MQKRKFDELVSYFNKKVSEMEIETKYKMELLGMVTALGCAHEKETHDKRTETHGVCLNTISRKAAIDALDKWESKLTWDSWCNEHKDEPEKFHITAPSAVIAGLPSAQPETMYYPQVDGVTPSVIVQPERKKGKWIEHNPHKWGLGIKYECSECGYEVDCEEPNFCPNCGADMRGENDGKKA